MKNSLVVVLILLAPYAFNPASEPQKSTALKPVYQRGRWGYADSSGKIAIEARFDAALAFSEGLARVGVVDEELPEIDGRPNLLWGYVDETGRVVVALRYNALRGFAEGLAACGVLDPGASVFMRRGHSNFRWGYVDREGREVIAPKFIAAEDFSEGLAAVDPGGKRDNGCSGNYHFGYVDKTGTFIITPRFAHAGPFKSGSARVAVGYTKYLGRCLCCGAHFVGRGGVIDLKGEFVGDGKPPTDESFADPDSGEVPR